MSAKLKRRLGQNTAEYLIMLTLVAVGSIGFVTLFGKQVRGKIAYVVGALSGNEDAVKAGKNISTNAGVSANSMSTNDYTVKGIKVQELQDNAAPTDSADSEDGNDDNNNDDGG